MTDIDTLTAPQRAALGQLQSITNGADIPSEIAILSSVNWDVQRAAEAIFDAQTNTTSTRPKIEQMQLDDSAQGLPAPTPPRSTPTVARLGLNLVSILTFPLSLSFNILSHLVHFLFRVLRIPFPRLNLTSFSFARRGPRSAIAPDDPARAADRFVRELEDETGAQVLSRARASQREHIADEPGPSSAVAEQDPLFDDARKILPDFWLGSYESALDVARRDARVLCVVLLSAEHDDVPAFRKHVLTDHGFVRAIAEHDILVWAGDVRDRDAYQASLKLTATTYPFVAFVALQPRVRSSSSTSNSSTAAPSLAIISRHSGFPATAASALTTHLTGTILPRHQPFLTRLRAQARAHASDRALRAEQDAAFAAAQHADAQRILARRAEEQARIRAQEAAARETTAARAARSRRIAWRTIALKKLGEGKEGSPAGVRVGVRVPDGRRAVRWFREDDRVTDVYAWVDGVLAEGQQGAEGEPGGTETGMGEGDDPHGDVAVDLEEVPEFPFRLAVAFPRTAVPCVPQQLVGAIPALSGGANLVVEWVAPVSTGSDSEDEDG